jgi:hypothetical protein
MDTFTLAEAKDNLEDLLTRAARGEDVRIADPKFGTLKVSAESVKLGDLPKRVPNLWKDKYIIPERLMEPLSDDELGWLSGEQSE